MANSQVIYKGIRFILENELTQCYVRCEVEGDSPIGIVGWYHKTFPKSKNCVDIMNNLDKDSPMMWPLNHP